MLDTDTLELIFSSSVTGSLTFGSTMLILASSIILGIIISTVYMKTNKKNGYNNGFAVTLVMLPVIISIIILLVGNNIARAFSLAGAFSIIRFRSAAGDPKDISYVFFTLAVGLACGMGYVWYAAVFTIILCSLMVILNKFKFAMAKEKLMQLKIEVPEDLNYETAFNEILDKYTNSWQMEKIKTRDFGALFELTYLIKIKENTDTKIFIDELRCRNGNLSISITMACSDEKAFAY